jgi:hypothetical protein
MKIQVRNVGMLPPRSYMEFETEASVDKPVIDAAFLPKTYVCIDCGWKTHVYASMVDHQRNQARYHTTWQRFTRNLDVIFVRLFYRSDRVKSYASLTPIFRDTCLGTVVCLQFVLRCSNSSGT